MNIEKRRYEPVSTTYAAIMRKEKEIGHMEDVTELSFQEKEQLLYHIGKLYRKGMLQSALRFQGMVEDCDADECGMEFASRIRLVLRRMDREDALILINDFLEIKKKDWWKQEYARSTYYRRKRLAMDAFLRCLYV